MITLSPHADYNIYLSEKNEGSIHTEEMSKKFLLSHQIKEPICYFHHQHQANRAVANANKCNQELWADAVLTKQSICLTMIVADCFPLALYCPRHRVLALIHAGWKPLLQNIIELTMLEMQLKLQTEPKHMLAWIGPGIRSCCYQFKNQPLQAQLPTWQPAIRHINNRWSIDLPLFINNELKRLGVQANNVKDLADCTSCQTEQYFSHHRSNRRQEKKGRVLVAAQITSL